MHSERYLFTSESVGEGHPDKLCDKISDAILDECLKNDADCHVACETFATSNFVLVGGEINMSGNTAIDAEKIARRVACDIGYTDEAFG